MAARRCLFAPQQGSCSPVAAVQCVVPIPASSRQQLTTPPHRRHLRRPTRCAAAGAGSSSSIDEPPIPDQQMSLDSTSGSGNTSSTRRDTWRVPIPPHLHGKTPRAHWNANALAFLGDSVWELYARRHFFYPPSRKDAYFGSVIKHVRAEKQEQLCKQLEGTDFLSNEERDVLRWGRNATGTTPKRLTDTALKRETYRAATAIECLAGYLYLTDPQRLHDMMCALGLGDASAEGEAGSISAADSSGDD